MVETLAVKPLEKSLLEEIGLTWHTDTDGSDYIASELVRLSEAEAEAYYAAANTLYDMYVAAAQRVIDQQLYYELGIPSNLVPMVEQSWEDDEWHLYGRFDLAGGIDGKPIKLIEFNADTPTGILETSIVQWAILRANGMDQSRQFNNIHDMLKDNFHRLVTGPEAPNQFQERYAEQKILFSSARGIPEDERTVRYLQRVAQDAGFFNDFCYLDEAGFSNNEGVFNREGQLADYWFKLFPWEDIATQELELTLILDSISKRGHTHILNPAYTILFQSKGIMKILYELFPDSPYLLNTAFTPLTNTPQVRKKIFGREGANTTILNAAGKPIAQTDGPYGENKDVYQAWYELPKDAAGRYYQAGVFYIWEACGLGFRRGGEILDDTSKFVGHLVD
ncbi:MAG: glutathionylspermidine synthase family protein [Gammaproteobacteria bacterium]|nr:glutathionylspermidine synthase family protein [Gammaproteobacteria bacterium]